MANQDNTLRIIGSEGRIEVADFWFASGHKGGVGKIHLIKGGETQTIEVKEDRWLYSFEVDAAGDAIRAGSKEFAYPGIGWADSIGNLRVLDQWRASIGLEYEVEKATHRTKNIAGTAVTKGNSIPKRDIPGITKPASTVMLGFEFFPNFAAASLTLDAFYEAGGNAFDTAYVYGGGKTESIFGDWHTSRKVPREEIVLIGKGAHSPLCYPDMISKQLDQSLNRLKTDYVDIYFMHRDNTAVPVGEFVDAMDAEAKLDARPLRRGDRLCREERQDRTCGAFQQLLAGRNARPDLGRMRRCLRRRMEGLAERQADPELRLVEPGPRLLHRPRRPRQTER
jgi:hypothetical protein